MYSLFLYISHHLSLPIPLCISILFSILCNVTFFYFLFILFSPLFLTLLCLSVTLSPPLYLSHFRLCNSLFLILLCLLFSLVISFSLLSSIVILPCLFSVTHLILSISLSLSHSFSQLSLFFFLTFSISCRSFPLYFSLFLFPVLFFYYL